MNLRIRIVTAVAVGCHLFLALLPVTSQTPAPEGTPQANAGAIPGEGEPVTIKAREQEKKGDVFLLHGDAEIDFRDYIFRGDEVTYDSKTSEVTATGHVTLDGGAHD